MTLGYKFTPESEEDRRLKVMMDLFQLVRGEDLKRVIEDYSSKGIEKLIDSGEPMTGLQLEQHLCAALGLLAARNSAAVVDTIQALQLLVQKMQAECKEEQCLEELAKLLSMV
jgi:hypothetical protein